MSAVSCRVSGQEAESSDQSALFGGKNSILREGIRDEDTFGCGRFRVFRRGT